MSVQWYVHGVPICLLYWRSIETCSWSVVCCFWNDVTRVVIRTRLPECSTMCENTVLKKKSKCLGLFYLVKVWMSTGSNTLRTWAKSDAVLSASSCLGSYTKSGAVRMRFVQKWKYVDHLEQAYHAKNVGYTQHKCNTFRTYGEYFIGLYCR